MMMHLEPGLSPNHAPGPDTQAWCFMAADAADRAVGQRLLPSVRAQYTYTQAQPAVPGCLHTRLSLQLPQEVAAPPSSCRITCAARGQHNVRHSMAQRGGHIIGLPGSAQTSRWRLRSPGWAGTASMAGLPGRMIPLSSGELPESRACTCEQGHSVCHLGFKV